MRVAVREGVEPGSQQNILLDALGCGAGEAVFGVAAAGDEKGAQRYGEGAVGPHRSSAQFFGVGLAEDGDGDGVVEDQRLRVVDLVCGAAKGDAEGGAGWAGRLHGLLSIRSRLLQSIIHAPAVEVA